MVLQILIGLVVFVAVVVAFASTRPDAFRIERSIRIDAPAATVFALVDDFPSWVRWSPWEGLDADLKRTYGAIARGKGAHYAWEGKKSGSGSMEITESSPDSRLVIKLDFLTPFEAHNIAEFAFTADGTATQVVWAMHGPRPLPVKVMNLFMDMDSMVGKDFEKGLAALKVQAEA